MRKKGKIAITITIGIICFILVMIIFMQFKVTHEAEMTSIETMREEDLEQQLADWKLKYEESEQQYQEITETLKKYKEESTSDSQTKINMEEELKKLELILGTTDVTGEGITITINDEKEEIKAENLMIFVNYLRDAGAEAIEINNERIVNSTFFVDIGYISFIEINGRRIEAPYTINAIGNQDYLKSALVGKGGYISRLEDKGINIKVEQKRKITISKYNGNDLSTKYINK